MSSGYCKLEQDLCRCCHSEGSFKNLAKPFKTVSTEEIYENMLKECYGIDMAPIQGMLSAITYTICEVCIMRLRDASDFKKQVLMCEERFMEIYKTNGLKAAPTSIEIDIKEEIPEPESYDVFKEETPLDDKDDDFEVFMEDEEEEEAEEIPVEVEVIKKKKYKKRQIKTNPVKSKKKKENNLNEQPTDENDADKKQDEIRPSKVKALEIEVQQKDYATETALYYRLEVLADGSRDYVCTACTRKYSSLPCVVQHYRHVHLRLRPKLRSCFLCEVKVPGYERARHLEKAHGIPAPTCNACGKKFAFPFQVLRHQKMDHMGEKKFDCRECGMKFKSQANLGQHMVKHTGVRRHLCEICDKSFKWRKNLKTHLMMHKDERKHVCSVCQDSFVQRSSLKYHITKKHPGHV